MSLEEKYQSVLNLLRTEDSLHDDTYLAQFLDNTARVINTRQDLDSYGLEQFLRQNLNKIRELGFTAEFNVKFILELSRTVIMKVPDLALDLITILPWPTVEALPQEILLPLLQLYRQVFTQRTQVLDIMRHLGKENVFWEKIFLPLLRRSGTFNNYLNKEILISFAEFVSFSLVASRENESPKGCEIKNQLENNLKELILEKLDRKSSDIFDILQKVLERNPKEGCVAQAVLENVDFKTVLSSSQYLSVPSMLYCYIAVHRTEEQQEKVRGYLAFLINSSQHNMKCKKSVILNVVKSEGPKDLLCLVFDQFLEKMTAESSDLSRYCLSLLMKNSSEFLSSDPSPQLSSKVNLVLLKQLQLYCDRSDLVTDKALRSICEFSKLYLSSVPSQPETPEILNSLLKIALLKMEVDDFLRSSCLSVASSCLSKLTSLENVSDVLQKLCSTAIDPSSLVNVRVSAVQCVTALVSNRALSLTEPDQDLVLLLVDRTLSSNSTELKSSAINLISASLDLQRASHLALLERIFPAEDVAGLDLCDLYSTEERIEMVGLATRVVRETVTSVERIVQFIIKTVHCDTDWDVKCRTLEFWKAVHSQAEVRHSGDLEEKRRFLERFQFFTGLILGYRDYEETVRCKYFDYIKSLGIVETTASQLHKVENNSGAAPRTAESLDTDSPMESEEEIQRILRESDNKLVQMMTNRPPVERSTEGQTSTPSYSSAEFQVMMRNISDPASAVSAQTELQSILDDILQSCTEDCQLDLIDCY